MPAQLTRVRSGPSSLAASTAAMTSSVLVTSAWAKMPPSSLARASPAASCMSSTTTRAPRSVSRRAVASPSPEAPPVTMAEDPEISMASQARRAGRGGDNPAPGKWSDARARRPVGRASSALTWWTPSCAAATTWSSSTTLTPATGRTSTRPRRWCAATSPIRRPWRYAVTVAEVVFHLAAARAVLRSVQQPLATDRANTAGTLTALKAVGQAAARRVISTSSSSVYGGAASDADAGVCSSSSPGRPTRYPSWRPSTTPASTGSCTGWRR